MRRFLHPVVAAAVFTVVLSSAAPAGARARSDADSVRYWNETAVASVSAAHAVTPIPAPVWLLYLTYAQRAVYDAVRDAPPAASVPAAVAAAAHTVLAAHFPSTSLESTYAAALADVPSRAARDLGVAVGTAAGEALLAERANDLNAAAEGVEAPAPGVWAPQPPNTAPAAAWLGNVQPFVLDSPDQVRPARQPALTSARYAQDYEQVRILGGMGSTARSAWQTEVATFWGDPPAPQNQRALRAYSAQENLDALATARLFALADTASIDALIACADAKFAYDFWRPWAAIPGGDTDGNPATVAEPSWKPLLPTPNFPEYPSNHSCATTAIAVVLDGLDGGRQRLNFTMTSVLTGTTHTFATRDQLIAEVADARIWGGLHFRFSTDAGTVIGRAVAARVLASDR